MYHLSKIRSKQAEQTRGKVHQLNFNSSNERMINLVLVIWRNVLMCTISGSSNVLLVQHRNIMLHRALICYGQPSQYELYRSVNPYCFHFSLWYSCPATSNLVLVLLILHRAHSSPLLIYLTLVRSWGHFLFSWPVDVLVSHTLSDIMALEFNFYTTEHPGSGAQGSLMPSMFMVTHY